MYELLGSSKDPYMVTFMLDRVVSVNSTGYLCGKCNQTVSVLLNKCVSCGHVNIILIFGLGQSTCYHCYATGVIVLAVVLDVIVITVILLSSVTIFSWVYPVLFYLQVN